MDACVLMGVPAVMRMALHRIRAMVGQLGVEPLVQHRHQRRVGRCITQLGAIEQVTVMHGDFPRFCLLQLRQAWHGLAMNLRRR